jgi:hypothetical protein
MSQPDDRPLFMIPKIPGTEWMALAGAILIALMVVSAWMQSNRTDSTGSEDDPPSLTVRLDGDPAVVLDRLGAEPIGVDMWRWPSVTGAGIVLLEPDGVWVHELQPEDVEELRRRFRDFGVTVVRSP